MCCRRHPARRRRWQNRPRTRECCTWAPQSCLWSRTHCLPRFGKTVAPLKERVDHLLPFYTGRQCVNRQINKAAGVKEEIRELNYLHHKRLPGKEIKAVEWLEILVNKIHSPILEQNLCVCAVRWHFSFFNNTLSSLILQTNELYRSWYQWQRFRLCPCATKWRGQNLRRTRAPGTWAPPSCPWSRTLCSRRCHTPAAPLWTTSIYIIYKHLPPRFFLVNIEEKLLFVCSRLRRRCLRLSLFITWRWNSSGDSAW